jgi:hypothetical protein
VEVSVYHLGDKLEQWEEEVEIDSNQLANFNVDVGKHFGLSRTTRKIGVSSLPALFLICTYHLIFVISFCEVQVSSGQGHYSAAILHV